MAITYLSGERIQGSSTAGESPTFTDDFSSNNWAKAGSLNGVSGGKLWWNGARNGSHHKTSYDLGAGNVSNTAWTLRFEVTTDNSSAGGANGIWFIGVGAEDEDTTASGTNTSVQLMIGQDGTVEFRSSDEENLNSAGTLVDGSWTNSFASVATKYVEITKLTATTAKTTFYTDNTFGTVSETSSGTIDTTEDLRYIYVSTYNASTTTGAFNGSIDNMKFYNGITDTSITDEKATIANVPVGTRYEETDTRKIFRRKHSDASTVWTQTTTNDHSQSNGASDYILGQEFQTGSPLLGQSFDKVTVRLRNLFSASSTYAITMKVWNTGSGNTVKATSPTVVTLNQLENAWDGSAPYDDAVIFYFSTPYTLVAGDLLGIEPQDGANDVDSVGWRMNSGGSGSTDSNTRMNAYASGSWGVNEGFYTGESYMILDLQASDSWVEKGTA